MVVLAQLVRVPDCGSGGRGFEPRIPPKNIKLHLTVRLFLCNGEKFTLSEQSESKGPPYPTRLIGNPCIYKALRVLSTLFNFRFTSSPTTLIHTNHTPA
jgi:hypothetical protein